VPWACAASGGSDANGRARLAPHASGRGTSGTVARVGRLRSDRPDDPTSACRRCHRPAPPLDSPAALYWELIPEGGEVVGVICPDCLTLREQRAIRAEKARVLRRLKRGLPL
jgi:hypothetical protein